MDNGNNPRCVLLFSGKRKSGKDFFTDKLLEARTREKFALIKISAPIKSHFAKISNLNLTELMGPGEYKEKFRREMIEWSDEMRLRDPGVFCRAAVDMYEAYTKPIWIVSDVRRRTDVEWFRENYGKAVKTVRIEADEDVRKSRGWNFVRGIDDVASECDLDEYNTWDWKFSNNGSAEELNKYLETLNKFLDNL